MATSYPDCFVAQFALFQNVGKDARLAMTTIIMKPKFQVIIDSKYCKGCGLCVFFCPKKQLKVSEKKNKKGYYGVEFSGKECTGCLRCALICPDAALRIIKIGD